MNSLLFRTPLSSVVEVKSQKRNDTQLDLIKPTVYLVQCYTYSMAILDS